MDAQNILFGMIKNAEMLQPHSEGDYIGQDGLLKCGKCHGMKQMTLDILGEKRIVPVVCNCEADRMREEDARRKAADIEDRIKNLRRIGITDERYSGMVFEADDGQDERTGRICRRYCENFRQMEKENIGLLLYGPRDTGKTFFASCIVNELIRHQYACMITSGPAMISSIQANYGERKEKVLETVQSMRLLVLDDLGVQRQSDYSLQTLYEVIDARYRSRRPLIVTTNLTLEQLKAPESIAVGRIYDRLIEMCTPVLVNGTHRRRAIANEKYKTAKDLLGI